MKKSFRTIALTTALALSAAPMLKAEPMGTNPSPQGSVSSSTLAGIGRGMLAFFGV